MTFMLACVHVSMYVCGCTCSLESNTNVDRVSSLITLHFRYGEWTLGFWRVFGELRFAYFAWLNLVHLI